MRAIACALIAIYLFLVAAKCERRRSEDFYLLLLELSAGFAFFALLFMIMGK